MNSNAHLTLALPIIFLCVASDQATKWLAKRYLAPHGKISFAEDTFRLQYAENTGAFLGLGSSLSEPWRHIVFTVFVGLFLAALLGYLCCRTLPRLYTVSLSLVCGGGVSNLIDRVAYEGRVVDFLNVGIGALRTGIFNLADMAITAGAIILLLDSFKKAQEKSSAA